ncbi:hypothetical protein MMC13_000341, partial [Lambiella insularis]|nr:hypothetical protein [Lambiella insularis]
MPGAGKKRAKGLREAGRSERSGQQSGPSQGVAQTTRLETSTDSQPALSTRSAGSDAGHQSVSSHGTIQVSRVDGPGGSNAGDAARGRGVSNAPEPGTISRGPPPVKPSPLNKNVDFPSNAYNLFSQ